MACYSMVQTMSTNLIRIRVGRFAISNFQVISNLNLDNIRVHICIIRAGLHACQFRCVRLGPDSWGAHVIRTRCTRVPRCTAICHSPQCLSCWTRSTIKERRRLRYNRVSFSEEHRFNMRPCCCEVQSFGQDISRVFFRADIVQVEANDRTCNCFTDAVIGQSTPTLRELGVWNGGTRDNRLIVTKQQRWSIKRDTQGAEGELQVHDLFSGLSSSHELTSISGSLNLVLSLGEPVHWGLVEEVEDPGAGTSRRQVMHKVCIHKCGGTDWVSLCRWKHTIRNIFPWVTIDGMHPVMVVRVLPINGLVIWDTCAIADSSLQILAKVANNLLHTF